MSGLHAIGTDGTVYAIIHLTNRVASVLSDWALVAFDSGLSPRWARPVYPAAGLGVVALPDGGVVVPNAYGTVQAFDSDGSLRWSQPSGGLISSPLAVDSEGTVYVVRVGVTAISSRGEIRWQRSSTPFLMVERLMVTGDGRLILSLADATILACVASSGEPLWNAPVPFGGGRCLAVDRSGSTLVSGFNVLSIAPDGTSRWSVNPRAGGWSQSLVEDGKGSVYGLSAPGSIFRTTGGTVDVYGVYTNALGGLTRDRNGTLYCGTPDGQAFALTTNGVPVWSSKLEGDVGVSSPLLGTNGMLYFANSAGSLFAVFSGVDPDQSTWSTTGADAARSWRGRAQLPSVKKSKPVIIPSYRTTDRGVVLNWSSVPGAVSYTLLRSEASDPANAVEIASLLPGSSFVDTNTVASTDYRYWLKATGLGGTSSLSESVIGQRAPMPPGRKLLTPTLAGGDAWPAIAPGDEVRVLTSSNILAFDRTPALKWSVSPNVETMVGPLVITPQGLLCARGVGGNLLTNRLIVLSATGQLLWSWSTGTDIVSEPACGASDRLHVTTWSGRLVTLDPLGHVVWESGLSNRVSQPPVVSANGEVVVISDVGTVAAYSPQGGLLWTNLVKGASEPAFSTEGWLLLTATNPANSLLALDMADGSIQWSIPLGKGSGRAGTALVGAGNRIAVESTSSDGRLQREWFSGGFDFQGLYGFTKTNRPTAGFGVAVLVDDSMVLNLGTTQYSLNVETWNGAMLLSPAVPVRAAGSRSVLDRDGRLWVVSLRTSNQVECYFAGPPPANSVWATLRGDMSRSGRASRQVIPMIGRPAYRDSGLLEVLVGAQVRVASGSVAHTRVLVDGQLIAESVGSQAKGQFPISTLGKHSMSVISEDSEGTKFVDGPWTFDVPAGFLRAKLQPNGLLLRCNSEDGRPYHLQWSSDLTNWTEVKIMIPDATGLTEALVGIPTGHAPVFYRGVLDP